jgi:hypothetical protein
MSRRILAYASVAAWLALCGIGAASAQDAVTLTPRVIPVGKWAEGIAFDGSSLWVAESGQRTIAQLDLGRGSVARRITVGRLPVGMTVGSDGAVYALVQTDQLVWQQFPGSAKGRAITGLEGCPDGLASSARYLWVLTWPDCTSNSGRVIRVDPEHSDRAASNILGEYAQSLVEKDGKVWVAHQRGQALSIVDDQTLAIRKADVQGASLQVISAGGANVYVGGSLGEGGSQGLVAAIDASTARETHRATLDQPVAVVTNDGANVVAVGDKGKIWVFSADRLELQRTITLTSRIDPKAALIQGDELYLSSGQQQGENGAVLILTGWRPAKIAAPASPSGGANDCPYQVVNVDAAAALWMYEDPDLQAPKVVAFPANARGLVADRCLRDWCHVTFRGASGWVERSHLQAACK